MSDGSSVQFSPLTYWVVGGVRGHDGRFSRYPLPVFSAGGPFEQFWHGQGCPLFDVVHLRFLLPTTALPALQTAPRDGFGEAVVACDIPEPWKFQSLDSCQKTFPWTRKEVSFALHPIMGHILQVGVAEKFPQVLKARSLCNVIL